MERNTVGVENRSSSKLRYDDYFAVILKGTGKNSLCKDRVVTTYSRFCEHVRSVEELLMFQEL